MLFATVTFFPNYFLLFMIEVNLRAETGPKDRITFYWHESTQTPTRLILEGTAEFLSLRFKIKASLESALQTNFDTEPNIQVSKGTTALGKGGLDPFPACIALTRAHSPY
jgi:hypothetical protein